LSITPVFITVEITESLNISSNKNNGNNSLGTLIVEHYPFYRKFDGAKIIWIPPDNLSYYFCEKNNTISGNFTLTIKQCLVKSLEPFFILPRNTNLNIWLTYQGYDLFSKSIEIPCMNNTLHNVSINITFELETSGQSKNVSFGLVTSIYAGKGRIGKIWTMRVIANFSITIFPIVDP
jgi:hypothetical protein